LRGLQRVKVAFDAARASEEEIRARLEKLGYQVRK
jgi:hypothetical protein